MKRLQNTKNSLARAITRTLKYHITPVLKSLHWLRINERINYKLHSLTSLTYKVLKTNQPQYLHNLISVQPCHNTRSSSMVTPVCPSTRLSLKITNRSFQYAASCLRNGLPIELCEARQIQSLSLVPPITHAVHYLHHLHRFHPLRFNWDARTKFEVGRPIRSCLIAFSLLTPYVTLWPLPFTFDLEHL